ncbi:proprotein convertase subtilisin/kexin type 4 isoform X2 [Pseudophryne corroboree]|uniref:proprotein convertase subtilisin/kexin type 4 isoform X2 n=1 Tax=Pseudophryne corroboree TaxID=495146 RepID=UPI003081B1A4
MMRVEAALAMYLSLRCALALRVYTNSWAVQVRGGPEEPERIARKLGFTSMGQVHWFEQQTLKKRNKRQLSLLPTDPLFRKQWYMNNDVNPDLNLLTAWGHGFTGQGVVVTILDDGLEKDHPDLAANFDPMASYDFNNNDPDPQPRYDPSNENRHGTRCAGVVASVTYNDVCGAGIAYNARIGGVRMLDGMITDVIEARSLSLNSQHIQIYSASWGPEDDGKTVDGPGILAMEAFYRGIVHGRGGLGSIFVWASGNGGMHYDDCNCDGYSNSIYTVSVGSTTEHGEVPWYSEACASTLTTTFSSNTRKGRQIVTTDIHHRCTEHHTGTSASAPQAVGIIALALEANPALTWRDVQHIVVRASSPANLIANDWVTNGVGRKVSHHYGYGLLDAGRVVDLAQKWVTTHPQRRCLISFVTSPQQVSSSLVLSQNISSCTGTPNYVLSLEHVQAQISLSYTRRGDLEIYLTSPMGTRTVLVALRPYDTSIKGYSNWTFMSTHTWDENPQGMWTLELVNKGNYKNNGLLYSFVLLLYGTDEVLMARKILQPVLSKCLTSDLNGTCLECERPFYAFGRLCLSYCPPKYFKTLQQVKTTAKEPPISRTAVACASCHPSCYTCRGHSANNCTVCPPFATYDVQEHSCSQPHFPRTDLSTGGSMKVTQIVIVVAMVIGMAVFLPCLICSLYWLLKRTVSRHSIPKTSHSPVVEMSSLHPVNEDEEAAEVAHRFLSSTKSDGETSPKDLP